MGQDDAEEWDRGSEDEVCIDSSFRETLVDMVNECLQHKPDGVPVDQYFEEHLEPVLSKLAVDCISSQPKNPVSFVQTWVDRHEHRGPNDVSQLEDVPLPTSPIATMAMTNWRNKERDRELESLRQRYDLLKEALETTEPGRSAVRAAEAGDRRALAAALESVGLASTEGGCDAGQGFSVLPEGTSGSPVASAEAVLQNLGAVLKALRDRGITSASAAFMHFGPDQDWAVLNSRMVAEIDRLQVLPPGDIRRLVNSLDHEGTGRVTYRDFRAAVVGFLASSRDFHHALSLEEFNAIMYRMQVRLQMNGLSVSQALQDLDVSKSGWLATAEFMRGLRSLQLGLSGKEVAQVFNSLSAGSFEAGGVRNPLQGNRVSIAAFEALVEHSTSDSRLKDWSAMAFARLRDLIAGQAVEAAARRHADPPEQNYLPFTGFASFLANADPSMTSPEMGRLWCVLDKEDLSEEPLVRLDEILRWMEPRELPETVPASEVGSSSAMGS